MIFNVHKKRVKRFFDKRSKYHTKNYIPLKKDFEKKERKGYLNELYICPSHNCNADCAHCYEKFDHKKINDSLSTQEIKNIIDQFKKMKGRWLVFCSGEFLLRADAYELIKYASKRILAISLVTNGILLTGKTIDLLIKSGLDHLIISIDSADESRHDQLRGVKGCFKKATQGLKIAHDKGLITEIWTYVSKSNINELEGISVLAKKLNVEGIFVYFPLLSGHLYNKFEENLSFEERQRLRDKFNKTNIVLEFPSEDCLCTGGGMEHVAVLPSGDVTFCPPVPYSYGNIKDKSLPEIVKDVRKDYKQFCFDQCKGQCPINFLDYRKNTKAKFIYEK